MINCPKCNQKKPESEFYKKTKTSYQTYCKKCFNAYCVERWINRKKKMIHLKGGKCVDCGIKYDEHNYVIFDFHHKDPSLKEKDWGELRKTSEKNIIKELDKCVLLCSNCHRMRHSIEYTRQDSNL